MTRSRRLADYELGGVVGHGLVGVLREGTFLPGDRPVVLEEIPAELAADADFTRRLGEAGKTASTLTSPHLVAVYDVVQDETGLAVVTEPNGGPTLASMTAAKPLSAAAAVAVTSDVLSGLTTLHDAGLHHGEISPATTVVTAGGDARIAEIAVAPARTPATDGRGNGNGNSATSIARDLEDTTALLIALLGDNAMPLRLAAALTRAPGRGNSNPYATSAEYRGALMDAADAVFGPAWRNTTGLAERARDAHRGAPALDLAAVAAAPTMTPPATRSTGVNPGATTALTHAGSAAATPPPKAAKRRRRWPWVALLVVILLGAGSGGAAWLIAKNHIDSVAPVPAGATLGIGNDLSMTATPASGGCDTTFGFVATATVSGSGDMTYQWERSTGGTPVAQTIHITSDDGTFKLTNSWRLLGPADVNGTMKFHVLKPVDRTVSKPITYHCT